MDAAEGSTTACWRLGQPEGREAFALNSSTGELRARVALTTSTGSFQLLVGATDAGNLSASHRVSAGDR